MALLETFLATATRLMGFLLLRPQRRITFRFGHAFPNPNAPPLGDPVAEACDILSGTQRLGPRNPAVTSVVWRAKELLGIARHKRPVYAFVGCLHPPLGRIGLIISDNWFRREAHGVSRCDTGGLVGCIGGFGCLTTDEAEKAVVDLSHPPDDGWEQSFSVELRNAFGFFSGWRRYLRGEIPKSKALNDIRGRCVESNTVGGKRPDRRLWTWEARGYAEVVVQDVEAIVLAPGAFKEFLGRLSGAPLPSTLRVLRGSATASGVHYFEEDQVIAAFQGK